MAAKESKEALELYKLHAELADRVSQRRDGANRTYFSALVGLMLFMGGLLRFGETSWQAGLFLCLVGFVGASLAISWDRVIRSYAQLNAGKFEALLELEKNLSYQFFRREWGFLGQGEEADGYLRLTTVERVVPWLFFGLYVVVFGFGIAWLVIST